MPTPTASRTELGEHLWLLARWYYSNPREGEIFFHEKDWPYRESCVPVRAFCCQKKANRPHPKNLKPRTRNSRKVKTRTIKERARNNDNSRHRRRNR